MARKIIDAKREYSINILLNGQRIKPTPNDLSICT